MIKQIISNADKHAREKGKPYRVVYDEYRGYRIASMECNIASFVKVIYTTGNNG